MNWRKKLANERSTWSSWSSLYLISIRSDLVQFRRKFFLHFRVVRLRQCFGEFVLISSRKTSQCNFSFQSCTFFWNIFCRAWVILLEERQREYQGYINITIHLRTHHTILIAGDSSWGRIISYCVKHEIKIDIAEMLVFYKSMPPSFVEPSYKAI